MSPFDSRYAMPWADRLMIMRLIACGVVCMRKHAIFSEHTPRALHSLCSSSASCFCFFVSGFMLLFLWELGLVIPLDVLRFPCDDGWLAVPKELSGDCLPRSAERLHGHCAVLVYGRLALARLLSNESSGRVKVHADFSLGWHVGGTLGSRLVLVDRDLFGGDFHNVWLVAGDRRKLAKRLAISRTIFKYFYFPWFINGFSVHFVRENHVPNGGKMVKIGWFSQLLRP